MSNPNTPNPLTEAYTLRNERERVVSEAPWSEVIDAMLKRGVVSTPVDLQTRVDASPLALLWCGFTIQREDESPPTPNTPNPLAEAYRAWRRQGVPAASALALARGQLRDYGWREHTQNRGATEWVKEVDGFRVELTTVPDSCYVMDGDGGHYVRTVAGQSVEHPRLAEPTPLNLPASHFTYAGGSRDTYEAWFPDGVEEQYRWARTQGGMSRGVAREWVTNWVSNTVCDYCSEDYEYLHVSVRVERAGAELARTSLTCDFIDATDEAIFAQVEANGLVEEALEAARETLQQLSPLAEREAFLTLGDWTRAYLRDARDEEAIDRDTPDDIIAREARKLDRLIFMLGSSFVANEFDESPSTPTDELES